MIRNRLRIPVLTGAGVAALAGLAIGLWPAAGSATQAAGRLAAQGAVPGAKVMAPHTCMTGEQPLGYAGVLRAGQAGHAQRALGTALLTQIRDTANGRTMLLARTPGQLNPARQAQVFAQWGPVFPQASERRFQSCDMTLSDRPADQSLVAAAIAAFVRAGYFTSASSARAHEQEVLVSDDPVAAGSVIVTFMTSGPAYTPAWPKGTKLGVHPVLHRLTAYSAIETTANHAVTGVARGGL